MTYPHDDPKASVGSFAPTQRFQPRRRDFEPPVVSPMGLVETTAAKHFARFGIWLPWYMRICQHVVPERVRAMAARLAVDRPWTVREPIPLPPNAKPTTLVFRDGRKLHFDPTALPDD